MSEQLDIAANRAASKYSRAELALRVAWGLGSRLYRFSPRLVNGWRRLLLRLFGARIGRAVVLSPLAGIRYPWCLSIGDWSSVSEHANLYNLGDLTIGDRVTISHGAHLCGGSHDDGDAAMPLIRAAITIEDDAWICADAFIGPGVTVGRGAVVGARAVVVKDVPAWKVVAGNPARVIRDRVIKPASGEASPEN